MRRISDRNVSLYDHIYIFCEKKYGRQSNHEETVKYKLLIRQFVLYDKAA